MTERKVARHEFQVPSASATNLQLNLTVGLDPGNQLEKVGGHSDIVRANDLWVGSDFQPNQTKAKQFRSQPRSAYNVDHRFQRWV